MPKDHGLSAAVFQNLVFKENNRPNLSDVQFASLEAGVGRGESLLVVSPTSTGKTQIALWAIAKSLESGNHTVYLVTHRALAKQKFEDFKSQLLVNYLDGDAASLVVATGDYVEDANEQPPADPLRAPLLVATYEKYLALLSAAGVPKDMTGTVIVCDEIQLLGDQHRGQSVEVLLTLLRNAGWKQFVGLSAVLESRDARDLANWLGTSLVVEHRREKHLRYECWADGRMLSASTEHPDQIDNSLRPPAGTDLTVVSALIALLSEKTPPVPVIVFCMRKQDTYDLAKKFVDTAYKAKKGQLSLAFDGLPETSANSFLSGILEHRVASHNADLMDEERHIVEQHLLDGKLDVVFATSTLAAGVNFPLGAAIFASWTRWDFDKRLFVPIESSEFHNMAGRVGRMGFVHEHGRVIYFAANPQQLRQAETFLALGNLPAIEPRVTPERFNQLALQLISSGLCHTRGDVEKLVCNTFSALRESDRNAEAFERWPAQITTAIDSLVASGLVIATSKGLLSATPVGKAIGQSGLLPETGVFLVNYLAAHASYLVSLLPAPGIPGDTLQLSFLLFSACLSSPEFRPQDGVAQTRFLPYPIQDRTLYNADPYAEHLAERVWHADPMPISAAWLSREWIEGAEIRQLEGTLPALSAGMLRDMYRNLSWALQGLASITAAAADKRIPHSSRPESLRIADDSIIVLAKLTRAIRRLSFRVQEGLPDDVLWLTGLCPPGAPYRLARHEILALRAGGLATPEALMLGSKEADVGRTNAFSKVKPDPVAKANWVRDACRQWKATQRTRAAERQMKRAKRCARIELVEKFYSVTGTAFERVFEEILTFLKIDFQKLDDKTKTGAPDYLIQLKNSPAIIMELKSREGEKLVDYNKAVEVLAASEVHGYKDAFCVTLCHPGVDPSVPSVILACGRLSVVESTDLGEALLRYCDGSISAAQMWQWLATPGQALSIDLPFREYG